MRTAKLGTILENAARLAGRQVSMMSIPDNWRALAALAVNDGMRRISAEKFPMMRRVEFRRYRPTWTTNLGWTVGQECWYDGEYWRLESETPSGTPLDIDSGWRLLAMPEVAAFIEWEQPWEPIAIDRGSVDFTRFAYTADPRQNPLAAPLKATGMSDLGVLIEAPAPKGVYIMFAPRFPNVNGGSSPSADTEKWQPLRVPDVFEGYLTRLAAADLLTEDQGKHQTRAAADREFEELCERYHEGNGEGRVRTGSFIRR